MGDCVCSRHWRLDDVWAINAAVVWRFVFDMHKQRGSPKRPRRHSPHYCPTRPLVLRNTDAKAVASVVARCLSPGQKTHIFNTSNSFIADRQLVTNAVDIDIHARAYSWDPRSDAWMAFWGFAGALPSIAHCWMMLIIRSIGLPCGLVSFISALYNLNRVVCLVSHNVIVYIFVGFVQ